MATQTLPAVDSSVANKPSYGEAPFLDLKAQFMEIREEVREAVDRVLESQHFILGPEVAAFEREVAEYVGAKFAVGCASGSDALLLAQMALGIGPGDEVITVPFTFGATAGAIARLGALPVFVDVHPDTFNMDERLLEKAITVRTRAIIPVHLFGQACNMDGIMAIARRHGLPVIEDAAQAIGARWDGRSVGTIGSFGCFSFFPSKNLGGAGDGGLITTDDPAMAEKLTVLRVHGAAKKYRYKELGINSRLDALQAAILRVKLRHLKEWTGARQRNAQTYSDLFQEAGLMQHVVLPHSAPESSHVYNQFSIRVQHRDQLREYLRTQGIPTEVYYPSPLHLERAFQYLGYGPGEFPVSEDAALNILSLPIFSEITRGQQEAVVGAVHEFYELKQGTTK